MRYLIIAGLLVFGLACAHADDRTSKSYAACVEKSGGVTSAMQDCMNEELERQDRRLNEAYKALMGSLSDQRKAQLRDAQRKWIEFRDANCEFYDDPQGGSAARLAAHECVVTMTAARAHELGALK